MSAKHPKRLSVKKKYLLYESSVQDPEQQTGLFKKVYKEATGKFPTSLCEDFCGTFWISSTWVKKSDKHTATGVDLSLEPLKYGRQVHLKPLTPAEKKRIHIQRGNVLHPLSKKFDVIAACNFSFYVLKERKLLMEYCKRSLKALKQDGVFILEMVGGAGFIHAPFNEKRVVRYNENALDESLPKKMAKMRYHWNHESYEPINRRGVYTMSFEFSPRRIHHDVFRYDWRIWTIPEVKECMLDAGFKDVRIYWEVLRKGQKDTTYQRRKKSATDAHTWICYVAGLK